MTQSEFREAAGRLGLLAILCEPNGGRGGGPRGTPFWVLSRDGREVGTFVPSTGSARVGKVMVKVASDAAALAAYAGLGRVKA